MHRKSHRRRAGPGKKKLLDAPNRAKAAIGGVKSSFEFDGIFLSLLVERPGIGFNFLVGFSQRLKRIVQDW